MASSEASLATRTVEHQTLCADRFTKAGEGVQSQFTQHLGWQSSHGLAACQQRGHATNPGRGSVRVPHGRR
jgi:hypothetical protein